MKACQDIQKPCGMLHESLLCGTVLWKEDISHPWLHPYCDIQKMLPGIFKGLCYLYWEWVI